MRVDEVKGLLALALLAGGAACGDGAPDQTLDGGDAPPVATCGAVAPLCGAPERPCRVVIDEVVPDSRAVRDSGPGLALDAAGGVHLLYASDRLGHHAVRDANGWVIESAMAMTTGGLVASGDRLLAVIGHGEGFDDGGPAEVWERAGSEWQHLDDAPGSGGWPDGVVAGADDLVVSLLDPDASTLDDAVPARARRDARGWSVELLGDRATSHTTIALGGQSLARAPSGRSFMTYWEAGADSWVLWLAGDGETPRPLHALDSNLLGWHPVALAVSGAADQELAHVASSRVFGSEWGSGTEVVYVRVDGASTREQVLARGDGDEVVFERCGPGVSSCPYAYTTYRPTAVVADGDAAVVLVARYDVVSDGVTVVATGALDAIWLGPDRSHRETIVTGIAPRAGRAVLDGCGRLHVTVSDGAIAGAPSSVRYLRIEAGAPQSP